MRKYTKEVLEEAVRNCVSISALVRYFGLNSKSGLVWETFKRYIQEYNLDTSHFLGMGHSKGKPSANRRTPDQVLTLREGPHRESGKKLRRALIAIGVPYLCVGCGLGSEWQGTSITLEVDHIDGNWRDCRRENLRFLCPNCHSQTPTSLKGARAKIHAGLVQR